MTSSAQSSAATSNPASHLQKGVHLVEELSVKTGEPIPPSTEPSKVTVRLTAKTVEDLEKAAEYAGLNRTDTINRAIQLYRFVGEVLAENSQNALLIVRNGRQERIILR